MRFVTPNLRLLLLLAVVEAGRAHGQEVKAETTVGSLDSVENTVEEQRLRLLHWRDESSLLPVLRDDVNRIATSLRLDLALTYHALALGTASAHDTSGATAGEVALNARWRVFPGERFPLSIFSRLRHRHAFADTDSPSDLRRETGALWGFADGFTDAGFEIPDLYFENRFFDERLLVRYGQMTPDDLLDDHRLRSGKRSFLNQAFAASPAVGFPGSGMGLALRWNTPRRFDFTALISNLESSNVDEGVEWRFDADALFAGLQGGWNFTGWQNRPARLQLLLWNGDGLEDEGLTASSGASLTFEQEFSGRLRAFVRYAKSEGNLPPVSHLFALGFTTPLHESGRVGAALAFAEGSGPDKPHQNVLELFYRWQPRSNILITPDFQILQGDGLVEGARWIVLGGLRIGITF